MSTDTIHQIDPELTPEEQERLDRLIEGEIELLVEEEHGKEQILGE